MESNGLESLLIRESVRKLYAHARKDYDMEANVPHWVRTLVHLFKGLSVEVKTIHNNHNSNHHNNNSKNYTNNTNNNNSSENNNNGSNNSSLNSTLSPKHGRLEFGSISCCIHDELMKNVQKEKEQFEARITALSVVIEENKTHLRRNCVLVNRIKEMGLDGTSNDIYSTVQRLNQFEQKCRSYEQLCEKVVKEKIRMEQKVELLEEVIEEFSKFTRCSCSTTAASMGSSVGGGERLEKNKHVTSEERRSFSESTSSSTMLATR